MRVNVEYYKKKKKKNSLRNIQPKKIQDLRQAFWILCSLNTGSGLSDILDKV